MDNFDLKKYLVENYLLKEDLDVGIFQKNSDEFNKLIDSNSKIVQKEIRSIYIKLLGELMDKKILNKNITDSDFETKIKPLEKDMISSFNNSSNKNELLKAYQKWIDYVKVHRGEKTIQTKVKDIKKSNDTAQKDTSTGPLFDTSREADKLYNKVKGIFKK